MDNYMVPFFLQSLTLYTARKGKGTTLPRIHSSQREEGWGEGQVGRACDMAQEEAFTVTEKGVC